MVTLGELYLWGGAQEKFNSAAILFPHPGAGHTSIRKNSTQAVHLFLHLSE